MKKIFIIALSCILFSCSSNDSEEYEVGNGMNPMLNMTEYTFSNQGDSIAIYSTIGCDGLDVVAFSKLGTWTDELYYSDTGYSRGYYGDWWYAASPDEKPYGARIDIVVQPNDTGEERLVPILIGYYDWIASYARFIQEK